MTIKGDNYEANSGGHASGDLSDFGESAPGSFRYEPKQ
jgi:hypothetical protein